MSVIVELTLPAGEFELGRILTIQGDTSVTLETMVPMGEHPVPFFSLENHARNVFEERVREHPAVNHIELVDSDDRETLYALDWDFSGDAFFEGIRAFEATVLEAVGSTESWSFRIRFLSHDALSEFQSYCEEVDIEIETERLYNSTRPEAGPWYGLTVPQRETLIRAVEGGYYSIPRQVSTDELADEFDISDQAVTERLRRAIGALVTNTLLLNEEN